MQCVLCDAGAEFLSIVVEEFHALNSAVVHTFSVQF
jgi:hypothetical protein